MIGAVAGCAALSVAAPVLVIAAGELAFIETLAGNHNAK